LNSHDSFSRVVAIVASFLSSSFYNFISNSMKAFLSGHLSILLISLMALDSARINGRLTDPAGMRPLEDLR
jgi:hypothetical protein